MKCTCAGRTSARHTGPLTRRVPALRTRRLCIGVTLACTLAFAAHADTAPWPNAAALQQLDADEASLWQQAEEFDRALARAGKVDPDPLLTAYLQGIMDKLYPEFAGKIRVRLLNAQQINAFALPNGSVYVNAGLIARFENEAQLATVLAHEGAHFTHRHSLQQAERLRNAAALALVAAMLGVPLVGDIVALSSMFGFSREHEREADHVGYQRLVAAGYAPKESIRTFQHLQAAIKAEDIKEPFFFASHPKLQERIDNFTELSRATHGGELGLERFVENASRLRLASLEANLAAFRYKQLILVLADPERRREYPPEASYYLGEAYRLRGEKDDAEKMEREYRIAIEGAPRFAPTHRALGLMHHKRGEHAAAALHMRRYLELAPDASDRGHVETLLNAAP